MKEFRYTYLDILNVIKLRLKLLISNKILVFVLAMFLIFAASIISTFFVASKDNSAIPIGIVDMDRTPHSNLIIDNLKQVSLVRVTIGNKDELIRQLEEGRLSAVYVVKKGVGECIESQRLNEIIDAYYVSNNKHAKLLSDIVLSGMLDDICYHYALKTYYSNSEKLDYVYTKDEYRKQIEQQYNNQEKTIGFDFDVVHIKTNRSVNDKIDTSLLYRQIIIGIIALILLIVCLMLGNIILDDYNNKVNLRITTTKMSNMALIIGDMCSIWSILNLYVIVLGMLLTQKIGLDLAIQKIEFLFIMMMYTGTISMLFICITRWIREIVVYQLVSTGIILVLGISSAIYILGFIIDKRIVSIAKFTPIGELINSYKNISLNNSIKTNIIGYVFTIIVIYFITYIIQRTKGDIVNGES